MADPMTDSAPFWRTKTLEEMTEAEWESLCDGCGRCCLVKLEDDDTGRLHATDIGCRLFDAGTCRCHDYANRSKTVPDCVTLTPEAVRTLSWLPPTCAYKLVGEGRDLPLVASARLGRSADGRRRWGVGPEPRLRERGRGRRGRDRRAHRQLAAALAEGGTRAQIAVCGGACSARGVFLLLQVRVRRLQCGSRPRGR